MEDWEEEVQYEDITGWILVGHLICGLSGFLSGIIVTICYYKIFGG